MEEKIKELAKECTVRGLDLEEVINEITSNKFLQQLAKLQLKNENYLKKVFKKNGSNEEKQRDYKKDYNEFWKKIVENPDGTLNKEQVMKELSDYSMVMDHCERAYSLMTNGMISYQNTMFYEVENIFNDIFVPKDLIADDLINTVITEDMSYKEIIKQIRDYLGYYEED